MVALSATSVLCLLHTGQELFRIGLGGRTPQQSFAELGRDGNAEAEKGGQVPGVGRALGDVGEYDGEGGHVILLLDEP